MGGVRWNEKIFTLEFMRAYVCVFINPVLSCANISKSVSARQSECINVQQLKSIMCHCIYVQKTHVYGNECTSSFSQ